MGWIIFVRYTLEGFRQARAKTLHYAKLANIEQEEREEPGKFLDRLWEALHRFTELDSQSEEGKMILKNKISHSVSSRYPL